MDKKNLLKRVISAFVLIPVVLYCILNGGYYYLALVSLMTVLGTYELMRITENKDVSLQKILSLSASLCIPYFFYRSEFETIVLVIVLHTVFAQFLELKNPSKSPILSSGSNSLVLNYITLFLSTSVYVREHYSTIFNVNYEQGGLFVLMIFLAIWACDTFAYIGGSTYGKNKLYEKISPKKSIEGAVTGFFGTVMILLFFRYSYLPELPMFLVISLIVIIGMGGQIGDLVESMYKRDAKVKDSGNTIPGHGGVLDRIDSFIYVSPLIFVTLKLFENFA